MAISIQWGRGDCIFPHLGVGAARRPVPTSRLPIYIGRPQWTRSPRPLHIDVRMQADIICIISASMSSTSQTPPQVKVVPSHLFTAQASQRAPQKLAPNVNIPIFFYLCHRGRWPPITLLTGVKTKCHLGLCSMGDGYEELGKIGSPQCSKTL